jgi:methylglutaconyl-CoA hydratase
MIYIETSVKERVGYITLNRPEKRNALSFELVSELKQAFSEAAQLQQVKVIVLQAHGEAFCAGADLGYLQQLQQFSLEENLADSHHLRELFELIYHLPKVVIAKVQGAALAGGCGLASICDFSIAATEARFGYTEVKIGFVPAIVMTFLIRKVGEHHARQLLLSGEVIKAEQAERIGLITKVVAAAELDGAVQALAHKLVNTNSAQSMQLTKQMLAAVQDMSLTDALTFAAHKNAEARATDDCRSGIKAFLAKQELRW